MKLTLGIVLPLSLEFESNKWFGLFVHQVKLFAQKAQGKFGISNLTMVDSLNFLFQLFGAKGHILS